MFYKWCGFITHVMEKVSPKYPLAKKRSKYARVNIARIKPPVIEVKRCCVNKKGSIAYCDTPFSWYARHEFILMGVSP